MDFLGQKKKKSYSEFYYQKTSPFYYLEKRTLMGRKQSERVINKLQKGKIEVSFEAKMRSKAFWRKESSTLGKIRGWRRQLLVRQFPIHYHPNHFQAPAHVNFEVAVHEPYTYSRIHQQLNWYVTMNSVL